jgi:hypothetical protein
MFMMPNPRLVGLFSMRSMSDLIHVPTPPRTLTFMPVPQHDDFAFALGLRAANDKSMAIELVAKFSSATT